MKHSWQTWWRSNYGEARVEISEKGFRRSADVEAYFAKRFKAGKQVKRVRITPSLMRASKAKITRYLKSIEEDDWLTSNEIQKLEKIGLTSPP